MPSGLERDGLDLLASSVPLKDIRYVLYEGDYSAIWNLKRVAEDADSLWTIQVVSSSVHRFWLFDMGSGFSVHDDQLQKVAESTIILRNLHPTPPPHLRRPWNAFIDAVRASIIRSANQCSIAHTSRWAVALKNGFILANNLHADEWLTSGWEHVRSLLYVHLQIHPVLNTEQQQLIVHPTITQTPYHLLAIPPLQVPP
ncbi:hypothetical protein BT96DRAFT_81998 [Gymnopus androsaceus JB14]|uniref:Mediator complex subunit Med13 N-terminal domain-containing protein n=1 Tax=Gymnopus androsaceus JB14 TaxID=1447944 RepID=A0A6A4IGB9_9AGAR|nr:hypothetical protein BT96DRAFT_81998 [Gymnopus androsaceus JB14]